MVSYVYATSRRGSHNKTLRAFVVAYRGAKQATSEQTSLALSTPTPPIVTHVYAVRHRARMACWAGSKPRGWFETAFEGHIGTLGTIRRCTLWSLALNSAARRDSYYATNTVVGGNCEWTKPHLPADP